MNYLRRILAILGIGIAAASASTSTACPKVTRNSCAPSRLANFIAGSGAMLSYSIAMVAQRRIWIGGFGVAAGIAMLIGPLLLSGLGPHVVIGGLVVLCLWYLGLAGTLWQENSSAVT
jgi:hypothetical protein